MNPQAPLQPAPTNTSPQGVSSNAPIGSPSPNQLPSGQVPSLPQAPQAQLANPTAGLQNIADYYNIPRQAALNTQNFQQQAAGAGQRFGAAKFQAGVSEQNMRDQLDPNKYKITTDPKSQYGLSIVNPLGENVDFGTYINLTGKNPAEALQNSTDPGAKQFVQAYTNFEDYLSAVQAASGGDLQAQARVADYNNTKGNEALKTMSAQQVEKLFLERYGQYFGMPQTQAPNVAVTPTLTSQNNPVSTSPYYNPNYAQAFAANPFQQSSTGDLSSMLSQLQAQKSSGG